MLGATVRDLVPDSVGSVQKNLLVEAAMDVWAANRSNLSAVGRQTLVDALAGIHGGQSQAIDRLVTRLTAAGISQQTAEAAAEGLAQRLGSLQNADDAALRTALQAELGEANVPDALVRAVREWAGPENPVRQVATNWRQHEQLVTQNLQNTNPGRTIGSQVTLDVTNNATGQTVRIRIDNLVPQGTGANPTYQLVDAKFSSVTNLANPNTNLANMVTENQALAFQWISGGQNITVVPVGQNALAAGLIPNMPINVNRSVEIHVNGPNGIVIRQH